MKSYIVDVQHDKETDDYFIEFNEEILEASGFKVGDELVWTKLDNESYSITKKTITKELIETTSNWTNTDWNNLRDWLKSMLVTNTVTVTFNKKDGTERVMRCTLKPTIIPAVGINENKKTKKVNQDTLAVFDVDQNGWRSFIIKAIKRIQVNL